jgi:hypothetical protein
METSQRTKLPVDVALAPYCIVSDVAGPRTRASGRHPYALRVGIGSNLLGVMDLWQVCGTDEFPERLN